MITATGSAGAHAGLIVGQSESNAQLALLGFGVARSGGGEPDLGKSGKGRCCDI